MTTFIQAARLFILLTFVVGLIYPVTVTILGGLIAPKLSRGDLIMHGDKIVGARLIGQTFTTDKYFWPRPSASNYDALHSGASNLGPTNAKLKKIVAERREKYGKNSADVPAELLFASASGLDPHITLKGASFQIERIAKARGIEEKNQDKLYKIIQKSASTRYLGFVGNPYVNVLELNIALDDMEKK